MSEARCPECQQPAPAKAKFCAECGAKLGALASGAAKAGGERRQVTILFADITGYTRMSSELDPEELHALLERYFRTVDGLIRDFGGTVDKHIGDAVMGVFGAPVSHGNDPERAVRAALKIHEGMQGLSSELGRSLSVHIGIANGEVVAGSSGMEDAALAAQECRALSVQPHWWLVGPMLASLDPWFVAGVDELERKVAAAGPVLDASPPTMTAFYHARFAEACLARGFAALAERHAQLALSSVEDAAYLADRARQVLAIVQDHRE